MAEPDGGSQDSPWQNSCAHEDSMRGRSAARRPGGGRGEHMLWARLEGPARERGALAGERPQLPVLQHALEADRAYVRSFARAGRDRDGLQEPREGIAEDDLRLRR